MLAWYRHLRMTPKIVLPVTIVLVVILSFLTWQIQSKSSQAIEDVAKRELAALGAQNGLDYSGEMIDSINEYSVQFAKLGFTAEDMFQIMQNGAWTGAWNLDKVGDAIKELSNKAIDGSESTAEGFTSLGLNADKMAKKFAAGGESAKKAFQETMTALSSIEDPLKQNTIGVQLFGTCLLYTSDAADEL